MFRMVRTHSGLLVVGLGMVALWGAAGMLSGYWVYVLTLAALAALPAIGLDVLMGYTGYVTLAQGAMYGVGAYTTGLLMVERDWSFWEALGASVVVVGLLSCVLAALLFRTKGLYFAVVTLGIGLVASGLFVSLSDLTGGAAGYGGIPSIGPLPFIGWSPSSAIELFAVAVALLYLMYVAAYVFVRSAWGRRCVAIREDEVLARSLGVRVGMPRLVAFVFAGVCAAVGGSFFASFSNFISPTSFELFAIGFQTVVIVVVGGTGTLWGPLLAALLLTALPEGLRVVDEWSALVYGCVLLVFILFAPRGIAGMIESAVRFLANDKQKEVAT